MPKESNTGRIKRVLDLRRGSRTDRHKSPKDYKRKPKHTKTEEQ